MTAITISRRFLTNDDLIILPRREYEAMLKRLSKVKTVQLNRSLETAFAEYKRGDFYGPFTDIEAGKRALKQLVKK